HLDWTERAKEQHDHHGVVMPWDSTLELEKGGYRDAYRHVHPDEITHPGVTWPAGNTAFPTSELSWTPKADERDRIDFVFDSPTTPSRPLRRRSWARAPRSSAMSSSKRMLRTSSSRPRPRGRATTKATSSPTVTTTMTRSQLQTSTGTPQPRDPRPTRTRRGIPRPARLPTANRVPSKRTPTLRGLTVTRERGRLTAQTTSPRATRAPPIRRTPTRRRRRVPQRGRMKLSTPAARLKPKTPLTLTVRRLPARWGTSPGPASGWPASVRARCSSGWVRSPLRSAVVGDDPQLRRTPPSSCPPEAMSSPDLNTSRSLGQSMIAEVTVSASSRTKSAGAPTARPKRASSVSAEPSGRAPAMSCAPPRE